MTDDNVQRILNALKVAVVFLNGFAGILAAYPGPELSPLWRLLAAATVGGCGAILLFLAPPGTGNLSGDDLGRLADLLIEKQRAERG